LTVPTLEEIETESIITHEDSIAEIPFSKHTISLYKGYFEEANQRPYTDEETIELMKTDPNPEYFEKKIRLEQFKEEKYVHSDLVIETAKKLGIDYE